MATKRKTYRFRKGDVIEVEEYHDGRYGAPGEKRQKRKKPTKEQMMQINAINKAKKCRHRLLMYFDKDDYFITWTYRIEKRPKDMAEALKDFQKAMRYIRKEYKKRGSPLRWIRNIERGTRGAWHIHIVVNQITGTADIMTDAWTHGGAYIERIKRNPYYGEDFGRLAEYLTKDENSRGKRKEGTTNKPRIKEANYNTSRNMPIPEPKVTKLKQWKKEPRCKKGYYIEKIHEGINPATGYKYRRYTMIRLNRRI